MHWYVLKANVTKLNIHFSGPYSMSVDPKKQIWGCWVIQKYYIWGCKAGWPGKIGTFQVKKLSPFSPLQLWTGLIFLHDSFLWQLNTYRSSCRVTQSYSAEPMVVEKMEKLAELGQKNSISTKETSVTFLYPGGRLCDIKLFCYKLSIFSPKMFGHRPRGYKKVTEVSLMKMLIFSIIFAGFC